MIALLEKQLQRKRNMEYIIEEPKTASGIRTIPLELDVADYFKRILNNRAKPKVKQTINKVHGFLSLDKNNKPMLALHWKNISNIFARNTTRFIKLKCRKLHLMCVGIHSVQIRQKVA